MKRIVLGLIVISQFILVSSYVFAGTKYVDTTASGANNGSSWTDAYIYLQDALTSATSGDEIWVAAGTYYPTTKVGGTGDRYKTFQMINGVAIYGGFPSGGGNWKDRNPDIYETILSGDLNGDDGPDFANYAENSYHVVIANGINASAVLDGFTVTGGNADDSSHPNNRGGGMHCTSEATISNCTFTENFAVYGGGMVCRPTWCCVTYPTLDNCTFIGNLAEDGGAMFISDSDPVLTNCVFIGNSASNDGGAIMYYMDSIPILNNCLFSGNQAAHDGGGIFLLFAFNINITNSTFGYNSAGNLGGGIHQSDASTATQINNCILWDNTDIGGTDEAAQIYLNYGTLWANHNCIQGWTDSLGGTANHGEEPLFVDADGLDNTPGTEDDNLRLTQGSSCIEAGDNNVVTEATDLDGNPRIIDGDEDGQAVVDMGAYEFLPSLEAQMKLTPQTLNCSSQGNWVKAHFVMPAEFGIEDIDIDTPAVIDSLGITSIRLHVFITDDGFVAVNAVFDRPEVCSSIPYGDVELSVAAFLTTGQAFYGTDTIRITTNQLEQLPEFSSHWLQTNCLEPDFCEGFDLDQNGIVDLADFALLAEN